MTSSGKVRLLRVFRLLIHVGVDAEQKSLTDPQAFHLLGRRAQHFDQALDSGRLIDLSAVNQSNRPHPCELLDGRYTPQQMPNQIAR